MCRDHSGRTLLRGVRANHTPAQTQEADVPTIPHADFTRHWKEIAVTFLKLGATAYGGPAVMGLMQAEFQEKRQWVPKERFLEGLSLVHMLPGGTPIQLGIFLGHARGRWRGGVLAGLCSGLPGLGLVPALTLLYDFFCVSTVMRDGV